MAHGQVDEIRDNITAFVIKQYTAAAHKVDHEWLMVKWMRYGII